jgi:hypothetical protein
MNLRSEEQQSPSEPIWRTRRSRIFPTGHEKRNDASARHTRRAASRRALRMLRATPQCPAEVEIGTSVCADRMGLRGLYANEGNAGGVGWHFPPCHTEEGGKGTRASGEKGRAGNYQTNLEFRSTHWRKWLSRGMIRRGTGLPKRSDHCRPRTRPAPVASGRVRWRLCPGHMARARPGHSAAEYVRTHFAGAWGLERAAPARPPNTYEPILAMAPPPAYGHNGTSAGPTPQPADPSSPNPAPNTYEPILTPGTSHALAPPACDGTTVLSRRGRRLVKVEIPRSRPNLPGKPEIGIGRRDSTRPAFAPPTPVRAPRVSARRVEDQRRRGTRRHEPTEPAP